MGKSETSYTIPDSAIAIDAYAFWWRDSLKRINILNPVVSIDYSVFGICKSLKDVYYTETKTQWEAILINKFGNDPLLKTNIHYGETMPELVIDAPEALKDAFTVSGSGTVTMTIPVGLLLSKTSSVCSMTMSSIKLVLSMRTMANGKSF